jgi:hypothetical protein
MVVLWSEGHRPCQLQSCFSNVSKLGRLDSSMGRLLLKVASRWRDDNICVGAEEGMELQ